MILRNVGRHTARNFGSYSTISSMQQRPWEANNSPKVSRKSPRFLAVGSSLPHSLQHFTFSCPDSINPVHALNSYPVNIHFSTGLFKMIVGVLTTCHTQYTWDRSICIFYLIEQHSKFLWHTLQVLYMCTLCDSTNINTKIEFVPNCL